MEKIKLFNNLLKAYFSYIIGKNKCNYLPFKLWIETTARCNLACGSCINKDIDAENKGDMDFGLYKKIIDQSKEFVAEVNLFHRGEPLLHPNIAEIIQYAEINNIKTSIHTNATLLDPGMSIRLIKSGLSKISFSLDTCIEDDYEKNRTGANFQKTVENIINFLKIKKDLNFKKPFTVIQLMDFYHKGFNIFSKNPADKTSDKKAFKSFFIKFKGLPLDRVATRKIHNWGGNLDLKEINNATFAIADRNLEASKENIKDSPKNFNDLQAGKLNKTSTLFKNKPGIISCTFPWYSLTVFYDGKVYLCPQDFIGKYSVGDLKCQAIKDIFNNELMRSARQNFKDKNISEIFPCNLCDRIRRRTFAGVPVEYLKQFLKNFINTIY